jgi:hypothetical protein
MSHHDKGEFSIFVKSVLCGSRPVRGHWIAFVHLSAPNPSIYRQICLHPLLLVTVSMVEFKGRGGRTIGVQQVRVKKGSSLTVLFIEGPVVHYGNAHQVISQVSNEST